MESVISYEKQLLDDIEQIRIQFSHTQDVYREVCTLLFFRYGVTPTANKLYQLVRKGSMTAPADALNKFWEELREKSRVRIEHPDLPEALKTATGELAATLWVNAQAAAKETFEAYRSQVHSSMTEMEVALTGAEIQRKSAFDALEKERQESRQIEQQAKLRIGLLEQQLAATEATGTALAEQLKQEKTETSLHQQRLEDARNAFSIELDKLHTASELANTRFRAAEKRALLEIDRERSQSAQHQKELSMFRTEIAKTIAAHQLEMQRSQDQLGDMRQQIGKLEGALQVMTANRDTAMHDIKVVQIQLTDHTNQWIAAQAETAQWRLQAEQTQQLLAELRMSIKPVSRARKKCRVNKIICSK